MGYQSKLKRNVKMQQILRDALPEKGVEHRIENRRSQI